MATSPKFRKHFCSRCFIPVDKMTRLEQDQHEKECLMQQKLR